jgi:hypothetical protein
LNDIHFELQQAQRAFAGLAASTQINLRLAGAHLKTAMASRDGKDRREWESLFKFWRTIIDGGWSCPSCGGRMETGQSSGVRCSSWKCNWVPGQPI